MTKLTASGEMMKELFKLTYSHIHIEDNSATNKLINQYANEVDCGMNHNKALDYLQDGIMSRGLATFTE